MNPEKRLFAKTVFFFTIFYFNLKIIKKYIKLVLKVKEKGYLNCLVSDLKIL